MEIGKLVNDIKAGGFKDVDKIKELKAEILKDNKVDKNELTALKDLLKDSSTGKPVKFGKDDPVTKEVQSIFDSIKDKVDKDIQRPETENLMYTMLSTCPKDDFDTIMAKTKDYAAKNVIPAKMQNIENFINDWKEMNPKEEVTMNIDGKPFTFTRERFINGDEQAKAQILAAIIHGGC